MHCRGIGGGLKLDKHLLGAILRIGRRAKTDLKNLLGKFGAQKHEFVKLEEEKNSVAIAQLEFFVGDCRIHHVLQGARHSGQHDDLARGSVVLLNVPHEKDEQVFDLVEGGFRLVLGRGLQRRSCLFLRVAIKDVGDAVECRFTHILLLLNALLLVVCRLHRLQYHPPGRSDDFLEHFG